MDIPTVREFLFWCLLINIAIYLVTTIAWLLLRDFYTGILTRTFRLEEGEIRRGVFAYTAHYKLLITVFNFTPWLALTVMA